MNIILNPTSDDVKQKIKESIDDLRREEALEIRNLNRVKDECAKEKTECLQETESYLAWQKERREEARKETEAIENFRKTTLADILRPIDEIKKEAEDRLKDVEIREKALEVREQNVQTAEENSDKRKIELDNKESDIVALNNKLDEREKNVSSEEERIAEENKQLQKDKNDFTEYKRLEEEKIANKKRVVDDREKVNNIKHGELENWEKELDEKKAKLDDRQATLDSAWKEFNSKQNNT